MPLFVTEVPGATTSSVTSKTLPVLKETAFQIPSLSNVKLACGIALEDIDCEHLPKMWLRWLDSNQRPGG